MKWEAFCRALGAKFAPDRPELFPLEQPPENAGELAEAARKLLQDPVFRLVMERVEQGLIQRWRHSALGERDQREAVYLLHTAIEELRAELARMTTITRRTAA